MEKTNPNGLKISKSPFHSQLLEEFRKLGRIVGNKAAPTSSNIFASKNGPNQDVEHTQTFNLRHYIIASQRMHEIEGQKAMLIALSRHERWKAGGPV